MLKINGEDVDMVQGTVLTKYLEDSGYHIGRLAVEINGDIIPKKNYGSTILHDGDRVEIVSFVGGG